MGQKVNPNGFRIGIINSWHSSWFASGKDYSDQLKEDLIIRKILSDLLKTAAVSKILIERSAKKITINIHSARPGLVIGKKGSDIENIKKQLSMITKAEVNINISEIRKSEVVAELVAYSVANQLEKRVSFRRAIKRASVSAMKMRAKGIRINVKGRLGGAEIARMEWSKEGRVPLHTLRSNVQYSMAEANTVYGVVGVKVWIYHGDKNKVSNNKLKKNYES